MDLLEISVTVFGIIISVVLVVLPFLIWSLNWTNEALHILTLFCTTLLGLVGVYGFGKMLIDAEYENV